MGALAKVREFLKDLVGVEEFTENSKLVDDLGMCEAEVAELLLNLEEEYSLPEVTAEEYYSVFTVADVLAVVEKKLNPGEVQEPLVEEPQVEGTPQEEDPKPAEEEAAESVVDDATE